MKVFLSITRHGNDVSPIQMALGQIVRVTGGEVVEDIETAQLIVLDSPQQALRLLKDTEDVPIVLCPIGQFGGDKTVVIAAESLARTYSDRIVLRHIMAKSKEDDNNPEVGIVPYLMAIVGKEKTA
jgi:hypothetical protein